MLIWVPQAPVAAALEDLPDVTVDVVVPAPDAMPPGGAEVEFYIPPFFPDEPALEIIGRLPKLRVVQTMTAGVDRVLPRTPPQVTVCNARGVHDASTAEWVIAAILAVVRDFPYFAVERAARRWSYRFTDCLAGKTVLIVGHGSIGRAVEARLAGFGVEIVRVARGARPGVAPVDELPALLPGADVVVLLVPVTAETTAMVDAAFLARMKDGAVLVNAARGCVVSAPALLAELRSGRLRAALDVTDPEPLGPGDPLWDVPGLLLTPHVAASTSVSVSRALDFLRGQVTRYVRGESLLNVIRGEY